MTHLSQQSNERMVKYDALHKPVSVYRVKEQTIKNDYIFPIDKKGEIFLELFYT